MTLREPVFEKSRSIEDIDHVRLMASQPNNGKGLAWLREEECLRG